MTIATLSNNLNNPLRCGRTTVRAGLASVFLWLTLVAGCATKPPIEAWQQRVTTYVFQQGNGDPNILRDLVVARARDSVRPERIMIGEFGVVGKTENGRTPTYDVQGIVVGHSQIAGRNWFLFLVGVLRQQSVGAPTIDEVRLAAMTAESQQLHWSVSEPDAFATQRYVNPGGSDLTAPSRDDPAFRVFPKASDAYRVIVEGDIVHVYEDRSGAHWDLRLPAAGRARSRHDSALFSRKGAG